MALLSQYLFVLRNLIQSPTSPIPLLPDSQLGTYINLARGQVAIDAECVRGMGSATITAGVEVIPITQVAAQNLAGVSQAIVIRNARLNGSRVDIRPWDWFENYYLFGPPNPPVLYATVMAHQGQGTLTTLYFYSSNGGNVLADAVFLPVDLIDDTTPDAIPYPWIDAVAFYAAWYSYMSMQRQADGQIFFQRYNEVMRRGRTTVTSTALPENDPGGLGAMVATTKTTLGLPQAPAPQQQQQRGR